MTERPIMFSSPMVRALLDGTKTQTRRLAWRDCARDCGLPFNHPHQHKTPWQAVKPGDLLWVREAWSMSAHGPLYRSTDPADGTVHMAWTSPIHMPRRYSRLTLEVTATRTEHLQSISRKDALAEGVRSYGRGSLFAVDVSPTRRAAGTTPQSAFHELWSILHGEDSWDANPVVVVLTLRAVEHR